MGSYKTVIHRFLSSASFDDRDSLTEISPENYSLSAKYLMFPCQVTEEVVKRFYELIYAPLWRRPILSASIR